MVHSVKVYSDGKLETQQWSRLDDEAAPGDAVGILVSPVRWVRERDVLTARGYVGVIVVPAEEDEAVLGEIADAPLIAVVFPKFSDGRGYSFARLLRDRHGYRGDLRAAGDVLIDQVALMLRCGFSSLEVSHAPTLAALEAGTIKGLTHVYQAPAAGSQWRLRAGRTISKDEAA